MFQLGSGCSAVAATCERSTQRQTEPEQYLYSFCYCYSWEAAAQLWPPLVSAQHSDKQSLDDLLRDIGIKMNRHFQVGKSSKWGEGGLGRTFFFSIHHIASKLPDNHRQKTCSYQCCGSIYIEFESGSRILVQFGSRPY